MAFCQSRSPGYRNHLSRAQGGGRRTRGKWSLVPVFGWIKSTDKNKETIKATTEKRAKNDMIK